MRAEWALNHQWSAIAARDQNREVTLNFASSGEFLDELTRFSEAVD